MLHQFFNEINKVAENKQKITSALNNWWGKPSIGIFTFSFSTYTAIESSTSIKNELIVRELDPISLLYVFKIIAYCAGLLFFTFIIFYIIYQISFLRKYYIYRKSKKHLSKLIEVPFDEQMIEIISDIGYSVNGEGFMSKDLMKLHFNSNNEGFRCWVTTSTHNRTDIKAFFIISPLNRTATDKILNRDIRVASKIDPRMIKKRFKEGVSIYITEIYGEGYPYNACVLLLLMEEIKKRVADNQKLEYLFARPVSEAGIIHLQQNGFEQISSIPTEIWKKEVKEMRKI